MVDLVVQLLSGNLCLQALEDGKLELFTAFLVVQEMIAQEMIALKLSPTSAKPVNVKIFSMWKEGWYSLRRIACK